MFIINLIVRKTSLDFRQVFLFLILLLVTKAANFYFNYSSLHTE